MARTKKENGEVKVTLIGGVPKMVFTTKQAAEYLEISYSYLRTIRMTGKIKDRMGPPPDISIAGATRYLKEDLDAWLRRLPKNYRGGPVPVPQESEHTGGEM
ncbi:helix-turn-helix domain-containing protein [Aminobacterium sp. EBM-42]|uniref:helix-turn-helix domain-containing protein n=1 Tax=Aminobacterium sp. EBM-42 TaxID=1918503 RepID=UPI00257A33C0|nr:helix-turn-helix domain-containing protein [Aminobacterium sp. EBM-42]